MAAGTGRTAVPASDIQVLVTIKPSDNGLRVLLLAVLAISAYLDIISEHRYNEHR